jgi:hypothetical protein
MLQVSLEQQIIAYYLRTLSAESEAREDASLGAFISDTAENLSRCVNNLIAPLPEVTLLAASSSTTSIQLSPEGEKVDEKESRVIDFFGTSVDPAKVGHIFFIRIWICRNKLLGPTAFERHLYIRILK